MTIRARLTLTIILIILVSNIFLALLTVFYVQRVLIGEIQTRVRLNLNSARQIYTNSESEMLKLLHAVSIRRPIPLPLKEAMKGDLGKVINIVYAEGKFDMLTLLDNNGNVIYRSHNPTLLNGNLNSLPFIENTIKNPSPMSGTIIIPGDLLQKEGEHLSKQSEITIVDTPSAKPTNKTEEKDAMAIVAIVPFPYYHDREKPLGLLFAAKILNRHYDIVDTIKEQVFQGQVYQGREIGTSTIFENDLRIATNVKNLDGTRAIGTRMSTQVYDRVFSKGEIWANRAFVVNDWYITAYEPIKDPFGKIIGSLYVGVLEKPFHHPKKVIIIFFLIMLVIMVILSIVFVFYATKITLNPIDHIVKMCKGFVEGNLHSRISIRPSGEMGVLCSAINHMAEAVEQRENELKAQTQKQINQNEKLASIGRLAAGVAHEINNPLTGVLTFAHLLREKPTGDPEQTRNDLDIIIRETTRVREIVRSLLDFSRQSPSRKEALDLNQVIIETMILVRSQKEFGKVNIIEDYNKNLPETYGDKNQLKQVILNMTLNACEAIPDEGTVTIKTEHKCDFIQVIISDTGTGIAKAAFDKIFDPFFTTKPTGKGTGLGLSVSHGIIEQHGGNITFKSKIGEGTTFTVSIPLLRKETQA